MREELGIWRAADRGDLDRVKQLVQQVNIDVVVGRYIDSCGGYMER